MKEKSAQVQKMRSIYTSCTRAVIWLGENADRIQRKDAEGAFAVLEYIAALGSENEAGTLQPPQCMQSDESFEAAMRALSTVSTVQGPWWHRVWTVQEAMLPNDLLYLWGPLLLSKNTTKSATSVWMSSNLLKMTPKQLRTVVELGDMSHLMARFIWFNGWEEGLENLMDTMIKWRLRAATDLRDNVMTAMPAANPIIPPETPATAGAALGVFEDAAAGWVDVTVFPPASVVVTAEGAAVAVVGGAAVANGDERAALAAVGEDVAADAAGRGRPVDLDTARAAEVGAARVAGARAPAVGALGDGAFRGRGPDGSRGEDGEEAGERGLHCGGLRRRVETERCDMKKLVYLTLDAHLKSEQPGAFLYPALTALKRKSHYSNRL
ncbi:heterokaryon incompatibility protein-domain-containing protein [Apiospora arundinis]